MKHCDEPDQCMHTDGKHCAASLCRVPAGDAVVRTPSLPAGRSLGEEVGVEEGGWE